jgi:hypothetical protein
MRKEFAVEGFEKDISWDGSVNRNNKVVISNENIYVEATILNFRDAPGTSYASLYLENRSQSKIITIHNIVWQFIYKEKSIENIDKKPIENIQNKPLPVVLEVKQNSKPYGYRVNYTFMSKENSSNFEVGDKIKVIVEITYEVDSKKLTEMNEFTIVCIWVNKIVELP